MFIVDDRSEDQVMFKISLSVLIDIHWALANGLMVLDRHQNLANRLDHTQRRKLIEAMDIINGAVHAAIPKMLK